jgi:hypothetical protein
MMDKATDGIKVKLRKHPSYGISTGQLSAKPPSPESSALLLLQSIKTAHPAEHHNHHTGEYDRCLDCWLLTGILNTAEQTTKLIELLYITKKAPENSLILSLL